MELSIEEFLGKIVIEAEHYRCDFFYLHESIGKQMPDADHENQGTLEMIIATRDCGCEWIYPNQCDGESYNWHAIQYHSKLNHIYLCRLTWSKHAFGWSRMVDFKEINRESMIAWINAQKSTNEVVTEIKELIGIGY